MTADLSLRAAARRVGCTHKAIRDAVRANRIPLTADGKVTIAAVDTWNAGRRAKRGGATRKVSAAPVTTPRKVSASPPPAAAGDASAKPIAAGPAPIDHAALAAVLAGTGMFADRASAELARDSYVARIRQLEYEEKTGKLLNADEVVRAIAAACAKVRTRLLAIPAEDAPGIHRCKSPAEVQALLGDRITRALEDLCDGFAKQAGP